MDKNKVVKNMKVEMVEDRPILKYEDRIIKKDGSQKELVSKIASGIIERTEAKHGHKPSKEWLKLTVKEQFDKYIFVDELTYKECWSTYFNSNREEESYTVEDVVEGLF